MKVLVGSRTYAIDVSPMTKPQKQFGNDFVENEEAPGEKVNIDWTNNRAKRPSLAVSNPTVKINKPAKPPKPAHPKPPPKPSHSPKPVKPAKPLLPNQKPKKY